jgi:hypothetical protein
MQLVIDAEILCTIWWRPAFATAMKGSALHACVWQDKQVAQRNAIVIETPPGEIPGMRCAFRREDSQSSILSLFVINHHHHHHRHLL